MSDFKTFIVNIILDSGGKLSVRKMARSKYEAMDKAYTEMSSRQPDRTKYIVIQA